jgi:hypothetical protein
MAQQMRMEIQRALRDSAAAPDRGVPDQPVRNARAHSPSDEGQSDQRLRLRASVARRLRRLPDSFELRFGAVAEPALLECPGLAKTA